MNPKWLCAVAFISTVSACTLATPSEGATYSAVKASYPFGTRLCSSEVTVKSVSPDGTWNLDGNADFVNGRTAIKCYGTKITLAVPLTIKGKTYPSGTKLTVDKDLNWIAVSSWD